MECHQTALKGRFRKEYLELDHQALLDGFLAVNGQTGVSVVDDFSVDDLFDFSEMDEGIGGSREDEETTLDSDAGKENQTSKGNFGITTVNFSFEDGFGSGELSVPADDEADLEWLSHFVEDSDSLPFPGGGLLAKFEKIPESYAGSTARPTVPCFVTTPVPAKARSKRSRTGGRSWSLDSPSLTESSSSSPASPSSSSSSSPPTRKPKRKQPGEAYPGPAQPPRRCSHCGVQKTPQWRTGPLGAKTLCNACGVRYKSGRLLPEYRPACSPTFSSEVHSNHHRKVLEMRKNKDVVGVAMSESGLAVPPPRVQSF